MLEEGYIPKFVEEHLQVSMRTGGCPILSCASFVGMNDIATRDCFDWVSRVPNMVLKGPVARSSLRGGGVELGKLKT